MNKAKILSDMENKRKFNSVNIENNFELLNLPYKDITEMFNALSELYKNANDKTVIDELVRTINNPLLFIKKDKLDDI